jgi:sulfite reductase alpha subunit-like flavoprotein
MTPAPPTAACVHVFYATQTGNAEEIARRIAADLPAAHGLPALCLSKYSSSPAFAAAAADGAPPAVAVFVVATTGDGDVPDSVRPFSRYMRKAAKERALAGRLQYAILGLGDTNYENFCGGAKKIESQLVKAGAVSFYDRGVADDGTGMEQVVEPWVEGLSAAIDAVMAKSGSCAVATESVIDGVDAAVVQAVNDELLCGFEASELPTELPAGVSVESFVGEYAQMESVSPHFDYVRTIRASVVGARLLTEGEGKKVYHLELDGGQGLTYAPGDAFGVLVENCTEDVERALRIVRESEKACSDAELWHARATTGSRSVLATGTARSLLRERVELRAAPKKTLLRALAGFCECDEDRVNLLTLAAKPKLGARKPGLTYSDSVVGANLGVLDVIEKHAPTCRPPLAMLLDQVPPLAPRYYSAASAPETDGSCIHFAFSLVDGGLATTALAARGNAYLRGVDPADIPKVLVVPRASDATSVFRPPKQLDTPYIMVGPGTGVAPFRGFLRQRAALLEKSPEVDAADTMLFFGCRTESLDFLYADELKAFAASPTLTALYVAFSRDGPTKTYVQDLLLNQAEKVAAVLEAGGSIFICGDGGGMAIGVDKALHSIVADQICGGDLSEAKAYVKQLAKSRRYVRDIWYFGAVDGDE